MLRRVTIASSTLICLVSCMPASLPQTCAASTSSIVAAGEVGRQTMRRGHRQGKCSQKWNGRRDEHHAGRKAKMADGERAPPRHPRDGGLARLLVLVWVLSRLLVPPRAHL